MREITVADDSGANFKIGQMVSQVQDCTGWGISSETLVELIDLDNQLQYVAYLAVQPPLPSTHKNYTENVIQKNYI